jgi:hypothetical protein
MTTDEKIQIHTIARDKYLRCAMQFSRSGAMLEFARIEHDLACAAHFDAMNDAQERAALLFDAGDIANAEYENAVARDHFEMSRLSFDDVCDHV